MRGRVLHARMLDSWVRSARPDRVTCCLDCCLQFFVKKYGLDANAARAQRVVPELASAKLRILAARRAQPRGTYRTSRRLTKRQNAWLGKHTKALGPELLDAAGRVCGRRPPRHRIKALERAAHGHARLLKVARGWSPAPSATSRRAGSRCTRGRRARTVRSRPSGPTAIH